MIKIKRVYGPPAPRDGFRMLIDRLWPRGLTKEKAYVSEWRKDLAPSIDCESGSTMTRRSGTNLDGATTKSLTKGKRITGTCTKETPGNDHNPLRRARPGTQ